MKILHISDIGNQMSGIVTVLARLSYEQELLGHSVKVASINGCQSMPDIVIEDVSCIKKINDILNEYKPDVVLFHSLWLFKYIQFAKILKNRGINYGIMLHGAGSHQNMRKGWLKKKVANFFFFNAFLKHANTIIFLSSDEYNNFALKNVISCYDIIPNGCDLPMHLKPLKRKPSENLRITYLGRAQYRHKGLDLLIGALRLLAKQSTKYRFHVSFYANNNDIDINRLKHDLSTISSIASYGGSVYGNEKENVLLDTDLFILTSRYEGMPMGVLEALSYGVPCLLTPGTNMADELVDAGAGWKAELSVKSIADTIINALKDLKYNSHQYHEAAYEMSKRYDWGEIAKKHIEVMKKISGEYVM